MGNIIGERFRARRLELGLTTSKLAYASNRGLSSINKLETSKTLPTVDMIKTIGTKLKFTEEEIEGFINLRNELKDTKAPVKERAAKKDVNVILKTEYIRGTLTEIELFQEDVNKFLKKNTPNLKNIDNIINGKYIVAIIYYYEKIK